MSKGPLAVRWGAPPAIDAARRRRRRPCASSWRTPARSPGAPAVNLAYHWLDDRDNPIVWDGDRTAAPAARPRRARHGRRERARADPARALPARLRHGRREPRVVLGARQPDARAGPAASPSVPASRAPSCPTASSRRRTGRSACAPRTPRASRSSPARSPGTGRRRPHALAAYAPGPGPDPRLRRAAPLPVGAPRASSSSGWTTSRACRHSPPRAASPGSTTAGSCSASGLELDRDPVVDAHEHDAPSTSASTAATTR